MIDLAVITLIFVDIVLVVYALVDRKNRRSINVAAALLSVLVSLFNMFLWGGDSIGGFVGKGIADTFSLVLSLFFLLMALLMSAYVVYYMYLALKEEDEADGR